MTTSRSMTARLVVLRAIPLLVLSVVAASLLTGYSLPVCLQSAPAYRTPQASRNGGAFPLLRDFDFDRGDWDAYLLLSLDDFARLQPYYRRSCLRLAERATLKRMSQDWRVICNGADVATVTSRLLLFRDGVLVFESGVVLDSDTSEGFQHQQFGFAHPAVPGSIRRYAAKFTPVYWPIVVL